MERSVRGSRWTPKSEHLAHAVAAHANDDAGKNLHAFLFAFENTLVHVDLVADSERGYVAFAMGVLDKAYDFVSHVFLSFNAQTRSISS